MIESFRHKGLNQLFEDDNPRGVNAEHMRKLRQVLALMDAATNVDDLDVPTFRLHELKGDLKGYWSITVRRTGELHSDSLTATPWKLTSRITIEGGASCP
jgi:proteic killer suppression protein